MAQGNRPSADLAEFDDNSSSGPGESDDVEKALLHDTDDDKEKKSQDCSSRLQASWNSLLLLTIFNVCLFVASCTIWLRASPNEESNVQEHWKATSFYSPILERFQIPKITRVTNGTLYDTNPPSILRQRVGEEADAEWHRIGDHVWPLIIGRDDVKRLGKDPMVAVRIPEELGYGPDAYIAQTEVFHHLHCLDMLRRETSYGEYYEAEEGPRPGGARHRAHIGHCLDVLAQAIKCTGSVDMITFNWVENWDQPFPDFLNHKVCRDFDALLDWVKDEAMDPKVFQKMKSPPQGWPVLPEPGPVQ
ncbi:DOPA-dioxygenase [Colletotrichum musicola]|uniref:DOPA-dioxygenase n=1 Tax=Colletotrichum musicola TaxID=2175873 RepID=A0A8H6JTH1_9PEZI|nr:DOPA-dioxygenase [Colletotrichum musicola]